MAKTQRLPTLFLVCLLLGSSFFALILLPTPAHAVVNSITLSANPTSVTENPPQASTITATVRDQNGNVMNGIIVTFYTTAGILSSSTATTNSQGQAQVTLTPNSCDAGLSVTVTATAGAGPTVQTTTVTFQRCTHVNSITLSANPTSVTENPPQASTITATVYDQNGNVMNGIIVTFYTTAGILSSSTATTNSQGQAQVTLTPNSCDAGLSVTVTATAGAGPTVQTTTVTFQRCTHVNSITLSANPTSVTENPPQASTITATVYDQNGNVMNGIIVTFYTTAGILSSSTATTNSQGQASVSLTPNSCTSTSLTVTVTATAGAGPTVQTTTVTFEPCSTSHVNSITLSANPTSVTENPPQASTITATVYDQNGNVMNGIIVTFYTTAGILSSSTATTNSQGQAQVTLTPNSCDAGLSVTVTATAGAGPTVQTTTVTFEPCSRSLSAPTITASLTAINSGQSSTLSTTSSFSGGTSPYTCQWLHESPGAGRYAALGSSFSCSVGQTPSTSTGTLSTTGTWSFELQVTDSSATPAIVRSNAVTVTVNPSGSTLSITTSTLPSAELNAPYTDTLQASGGAPPYTWSITVWGTLQGLGLTLSSGGVLSGTPTSYGPVWFTATVSDSNGATSSKEMTFTIMQGPTPSSCTLVAGSCVLPEGEVGVAYSVSLSSYAQGGIQPYSFTLLSGGTLPPGITLSTAGTLSGTPTQVGQFSLAVTVTDSVGGYTTLWLSLTVDLGLCSSSSIQITSITPNEGPNNQANEIQIYGCGFNNADAVVFKGAGLLGVDFTASCRNALIIRCTVISDSEIDVVAPSTFFVGPDEVDVVNYANAIVSTPYCPSSGGSSPCLANEFLFYPTPSCFTINSPIPAGTTYSISSQDKEITFTVVGGVTGTAQLCWSATDFWNPQTYTLTGSGKLSISVQVSVSLEQGPGVTDQVPLTPPIPLAGPLALRPTVIYDVGVSASATITADYEATLDFSTMDFSNGQLIGLPTLTGSLSVPTSSFCLQGHATEGLELEFGLPYEPLLDISVAPEVSLTLQGSVCTTSPSSTSESADLTGSIDVVGDATILGHDLGELVVQGPSYTFWSATAEQSAVSSGAGSVDETGTTGVMFSLTDSTAPDGTPFTLFTEQSSSPPIGAQAAPLDVVYYQAMIAGVTDGTARICVTSSPGDMLRWNNSAWVSADGVTSSGSFVCGNVSIAALNSTMIAVGSPTLITSSSSSFVRGKAVTLTVTTRDFSSWQTTPTGTMTWTDSGASGHFSKMGCKLEPVILGTSECSVKYTPTRTGLVNITVSYSGDLKHQPNYGSVSLPVLTAPTTVKISTTKALRIAGGQATYHVTVTDVGSGLKTAPTGVVMMSDFGAGGNFTNGGVCVLVKASSGSSSCVIQYSIPSDAPAGRLTIRGLYVPDPAHQQSSKNSTLSLGKRAVKLTLISTSASVGSGGDVNFTAIVRDVSRGNPSAPSGSVLWTERGKGGTFNPTSCVLIPINSTTSDCSVTYAAPSTAGTVSISCAYAGDPVHKNGSAKLALKVD